MALGGNQESCGHSVEWLRSWGVCELCQLLRIYPALKRRISVNYPARPKLEKHRTYPRLARCEKCGASPAMHPSACADGTTCEQIAYPLEDCEESYWFWCVPCDGYHSFRTKVAKGEEERPDGSRNPVWQFNGDMERPTFTPSLLCRSEYKGGEHGPARTHICHLHLNAGRLEYCGDCTHPYAGMTALLGAQLP